MQLAGYVSRMAEAASELDELIDKAATAPASRITFVRSLPGAPRRPLALLVGAEAPKPWTAMIAMGENVQAIGRGETQEDALYQALQALGIVE